MKAPPMPVDVRADLEEDLRERAQILMQARRLVGGATSDQRAEMALIGLVVDLATRVQELEKMVGLKS